MEDGDEIDANFQQVRPCRHSRLTSLTLISRLVARDSHGWAVSQWLIFFPCCHVHSLIPLVRAHDYSANYIYVHVRYFTLFRFLGSPPVTRISYKS
jgi:hypothetical protein